MFLQKGTQDKLRTTVVYRPTESSISHSHQISNKKGNKTQLVKDFIRYFLPFVFGCHFQTRPIVFLLVWLSILLRVLLRHVLHLRQWTIFMFRLYLQCPNLRKCLYQSKSLFSCVEPHHPMYEGKIHNHQTKQRRMRRMRNLNPQTIGVKFGFVLLGSEWQFRIYTPQKDPHQSTIQIKQNEKKRRETIVLNGPWSNLQKGIQLRRLIFFVAL